MTWDQSHWQDLNGSLNALANMEAEHRSRFCSLKIVGVGRVQQIIGLKLAKTNMESENGPLEKEIPFFNYHFSGSMVVFFGGVFSNAPEFSWKQELPLGQLQSQAFLYTLEVQDKLRERKSRKETAELVIGSRRSCPIWDSITPQRYRTW